MEAEELQGKLAEARQALEGNDQMIRWLNNQVPFARQLLESALCCGPGRPEMCHALTFCCADCTPILQLTSR